MKTSSSRILGHRQSPPLLLSTYYYKIIAVTLDFEYVDISPLDLPAAFGSLVCTVGSCICSRLGSKYGDRKVVTAAVNMLFFISLLHVFMMVGGVITPSDPLERPENWGMRESRFAEMMAIESTGSKITGLKFYRQLVPPSNCN